MSAQLRTAPAPLSAIRGDARESRATRGKTVLPSPTMTHSRLGRVWAVVSDLLIATALIWALPLLLAASAALFRLLL